MTRALTIVAALATAGCTSPTATPPGPAPTTVAPPEPSTTTTTAPPPSTSAVTGPNVASVPSAAPPDLPPAGVATADLNSGRRDASGLEDAPIASDIATRLTALRACESGGNYRAVSRSGRYRGAYQMDARTWASVGGSGDPAAATEAEQDARAAALLASRGTQPWPVCGRAA